MADDVLTPGLEEPYPYLILDARYAEVREDGAVRSHAVLGPRDGCSGQMSLSYTLAGYPDYWENYLRTSKLKTAFERSR